MSLKTSSLLFIAALMVAALALPARAQVNPRGEASLKLGGGNIKVSYGRPPLDGRNLLDMIQPGVNWRMGADNPTTLTTDIPLKVGGTTVPKGKHILLAQFTGKRSWTLVFSKKSVFEFQESDKIAEVIGTLVDADQATDRVTISLEGSGKQGKLILAWGKFRLEAPFSAAN